MKIDNFDVSVGMQCYTRFWGCMGSFAKFVKCALL